MLAVDADPRLRYARIKKRASSTDNVSYEEFVAQEQREMHSTDPNKQNIFACMKLADYNLMNNGTIPELEVATDLIFKFLKRGVLL